MKYLITLTAVLLTCANFVACGKKNNGGSAGGPVPPPLAPMAAPPVVAGVTVGLKFGGSLHITSNNAFKELIRDRTGRCDQPGTWTYVLGGQNPADCDTYGDAGYLIISTADNSGATVNVVVGAGRSSPMGSTIYENNPWGAYYMGQQVAPLEIQAPGSQVGAFNDSQGFEFRQAGSFGGFGTSSLTGSRVLIGQVANGRLTDGSFDVVLYYNGRQFATTHVERY